MEFQDVLDTLQKTHGVLRVHNVRIWALSMDKIALCAHIVIGKCNKIMDF
jgi:solute carrier family 30 (zinc transporter), member 2